MSIMFMSTQSIMAMIPMPLFARCRRNASRYGHIAGHYQQHPQLLIDTHGADVCPPVWQLLAYAYQCHGVFPTLLERDFNLPELADLTAELRQIKQIQQQHKLNALQQVAG